MRTPLSLKNESGVILVTTVILTIVLSIVAIGIMSLNVSQIKTASSVVDTIRAEELATGIFYQDYQRRVDGVGNSPASISIAGRTYSITRQPDIVAPGAQNFTNQVRFDITY